MSDNVRWEPLQPGEPVDYDMTIGSNSELRVVTELGEMVVEFDDDIRLCRAVPAPQWSQEPPTEAGWWWRWSPPRGVELYLIEPELGDGPLWNATDPADDMMYPVSRTVSVPGIYWLPATVPQPPGEEVTP